MARAPGRFLGEEDSPVPVRDNQVRVERGRDPEQGPQQLESRRARQALPAEVLHGARPVNIGQQAFVTQSEATQDFTRRDRDGFREAGETPLLPIDSPLSGHESEKAQRQQNPARGSRGARTGGR